ncbi:ATP-binding SpoIIE family protein phosphatase [Streptodolium elevatio]|uniref:ATP-binding SpoIIE family protein phosphatase n=1 Tax=Streptodolium elevatio TaxID=3157996 RepID=A0ABV3DUE4_9ACTN
MGPVTLHVVHSDDVAWFRDNLGSVRGAAAALGRRIGLDEQRCGEIALAASELVSNLVKHAVDGAIVLRVLRAGDEAGVELVAVDRGPGMADTEAAVQDGCSSVGTLGIGLGAIARLADLFDIHSVPGFGTVVAARFWSARGAGRPDAGTSRQGPEAAAAGITRAISGEEVCGDAWATRVDDGDGRQSVRAPAGRTASPGLDWSALTGFGTRGDTGRAWATGTAVGTAPAAIGAGPALMVMLCDGLGHGPMAAKAAEAATRTFRGGGARHPQDAIQEVHVALRGTRGAAVAVARIEPAAERVLFCGVGNISGVLLGAETHATLTSYPGIVGHQMRKLRSFVHPLPPGGALVMHSDGLTDRWSLDTVPGLLSQRPVVVAAHLLAHAGVRRDDASVVVAKGAW